MPWTPQHLFYCGLLRFKRSRDSRPSTNSPAPALWDLVLSFVDPVDSRYFGQIWICFWARIRFQILSHWLFFLIFKCNSAILNICLLSINMRAKNRYGSVFSMYLNRDRIFLDSLIRIWIHFFSRRYWIVTHKKTRKKEQ